MALLEADGIHRSFGGLAALSDVSFAVQTGQIKAVIGPNGAGKTTLFNVITGMVPPTSGRLSFDGVFIEGKAPHQIARLGIARTFQNLNLFGNMTVLENVMVGRHCRTRAGLLAGALRLPSQRAEERAVHEQAMEFLRDVGLAERADEPVGALSFGQRRMVELARSLATEPRLLLLDEPASGLNPRETDELAAKIRTIRDRGVTVLLVEHDMSLVMDIADEILVLHYGRTISEGSPDAIRNCDEVISVYLGGGVVDVAG